MISKSQIKLVRQLDQKKFRRIERLFVAEGPKVVGDLLKRWQPVSVFATEAYTPPYPVEVQRITDDELRRLSFLQHPQQVVAMFPLPTPSPVTFLSEQNEQSQARPSSDTLVLALDGIQDPGNLGTIIRLADWFGIDNIICSEDTADAWNPKVVQATMGSIARVNIVYTNLSEMLDHLPADVAVYGTLLDGDNIYEQELTEGGIIVMGNEGNGLSPEVRRRVNRRLFIPSYRDDTAESLNVAIATAIVCSEFRRR
ncbi:MAG: RNA methyltransferase [Prevotella sp.]|nr:RNA methyltransferase [Prevotella sp.]